MKKNLLIVEDDKAMQEIISLMLMKEGYEILMADSVSEALKIIDDITPDLILSDYNLPSATGYEFLSYIRDKSNIPDVPFILMSANITRELKNNVDKLEGKYLEKPIKKAKLISTIESSTNLNNLNVS